MQLLKMDKPQCLLYAAAMVLDVDPETLIKEIGHDGLEVWWPEMEGNDKLRGFHIQEIVDCAIRRGYVMQHIDAIPCLYPNPLASKKKIAMNYEERLEKLLKGRRAILIGYKHAVAWSGETIGDPNGVYVDIDSFDFHAAWILYDLRS